MEKDEYLDYLNSAVETFKSIVLKVSGMDIIVHDLSLSYDIEFHIISPFRGNDFDNIHSEIVNSEFDNWVLFFVSAEYQRYTYCFKSYNFKIDVKNYNRDKGLNELING